MVNDPIADFLIRLKNSGRAKRALVAVPHSKQKEAIADLLLAEGYLKAVEKHGKKAGHRTLDIELLYSDKDVPKIADVQRLSKQGRRVYASAAKMHRARRGIIVVSTSAGLMTSRTAMKKKLGGEVLFAIW